MNECRRCTECQGQEHHFLPLAEWDEQAEEFYYPCKHCDARARCCSECEDAIWPVVEGVERCGYCAEISGQGGPA